MCRAHCRAKYNQTARLSDTNLTRLWRARERDGFPCWRSPARSPSGQTMWPWPGHAETAGGPQPAFWAHPPPARHAPPGLGIPPPPACMPIWNRDAWTPVSWKHRGVQRTRFKRLNLPGSVSACPHPDSHLRAKLQPIAPQQRPLSRDGRRHMVMNHVPSGASLWAVHGDELFGA